MNMFKKNGGFTLVELIVVIAILAILATVAVPAYSGYIQKANDAACLSELSAIQTAAQSACALNGTTLATISIDDDSIDITAANATENDKIAEDFENFYTAGVSVVNDLLAKHSNYKLPVTWSTTAGWSILEEPTGTTEGQG